MKNSFFFINIFIGYLLVTGGLLKTSGQCGSPEVSSLLAINGNIILNTGDTIYGKIRASKEYVEGYISQIVFTGPDGEKIRYDADSISEFGIDVNLYANILNQDYTLSDYFECRPSPKKGIMVFMYRFEKGRITVFQNNHSSQFAHTWTETDSKIEGISFTYSPDEGLSVRPTHQITKYIECWRSSYYFEKDGGALIKVNKKNYGSLWHVLFADCPEIAEEVHINPDLQKFKNFLLLVRIYNQICY